MPYRQPTPDGYLAAWADLRRRRRATAMATAATLVLVFVVEAAAARWGVAGLGLTLLPAVLLMQWLWRRDVRVREFKCPRCTNTFALHLPNGLHLLFTRRCLHCGIEIGTPKGAP